MRIALAQFGAGREKHANLERMLEITGAAAGRGAELGPVSGVLDGRPQCR
jgi:predicted amidohydrolase